MSFESNRQDFEKALDKSLEKLEWLDELIVPNILNQLTDMGDEYKLHYSHSIDELVDDNIVLTEAAEDREEHIKTLLHTIKQHDKLVESLEHDKLGLKDDIKRLELELAKKW